jgi:hypothetical protein
VNFIPRWLIIIIILILYARLYQLIYTAHNRFMSFNDDVSPQEAASVSTRRSVRPSMNIELVAKAMDTEESSGAVTGRTHVRQPSPLLKKMAYKMMLYPLVYMLIWTIPTTIRIYQSVTGKSAPFGIATVDKVRILTFPLFLSGFA